MFLPLTCNIVPSLSTSSKVKSRQVKAPSTTRPPAAPMRHRDAAGGMSRPSRRGRRPFLPRQPPTRPPSSADGAAWRRRETPGRGERGRIFARRTAQPRQREHELLALEARPLVVERRTRHFGHHVRGHGRAALDVRAPHRVELPAVTRGLDHRAEEPPRQRELDEGGPVPAG